MIVRPARGSHICLRCQRGLARRANASASRRVSQSTDPKPREPPERRVVRRVADADVEHNSHQNFPRGLGNALNYKTFRNGVGGGLHGHRGLQVQENREPLNTTTLGDPADVLVLRDSILTLYAAGGPRSMEVMEPEHIDILSQLEEERGLVGQEEVESNIEAFRPANERQSWEDINELVKELQDGFTMSQLQRYIRNFEGRRDPESPLEEWVTSKKDAKILRITPWLPGVSEIKDHFDNDPLRGYFLPSHTVKQRVVLQLLRECWMLELPELVDGIGQFEIEVHKEDLELLLMGRTSVLDHIHTEHLHQENEKLEAFRKRSVIRVTCPHVKKPFIVLEIEEALKRVLREDLFLANLVSSGSDKLQQRRVERWVDRNFDSATLQVLGRLTNTNIVQQQQKTKLTISCIDTKQSALASPVDVARRLLLTSINIPDRVEHQLVSDTTNVNGAFIKHEVGNTLHWRDRLRDWSRWTAPTAKGAAKVSKPVTTEPVLVSQPSSPRQQGEARSETDVAPTVWNDKYFTETSAVIGKVLHSNLTFPNSSLNPLTLGGPNQTYTFCTQVQNLSRLLSKSQVLLGGERTDSLVLRFLPNPFVATSQLTKGKYMNKKPVKTHAIGSQALMAFPTIEMRFKIDRETKHAKLAEVRAVVQESKTDVMLPHNNTDVRFQQRTTSRLLARASQPVRDYLRRSNLSLKGSEILQTPPSICLPIEKHLCRGQGFKLLDDVDIKGNKHANPNVRDVEYLFAGLEIRSALSFEYNSWRLFYTSIEAGKAGGRRAELKLRPILGGKITEENNFVSMAYKLASEIGDQDPQNLVPNILAKPRRVSVDVEPKIARRVQSNGPSVENQEFRYFARRVTLGPTAPGDSEEHEEVENERMELEEESDDFDGEDVAEQKEEMSEVNKQANESEQETVNEEGAAEDMEDDKKIEDTRI
ncbi:mitochondrial inner-membrane-bound regulator-domain-containing protein [Rhexocercosporidium sp. MPI-PUGE-AT-0058]|nr:mitochondrial inner-membrane-bound regulator-domain-containing protein [Rhexocercosporidium sp. MPI-PUGE-AT-0058]